MTGVLAAIRPDSWNVPLLLHVTGAAVLVGAVATGVTAALVADRTAEPDFVRRLAFRSFLLVGLPAWFLMRGGAEWIRSKEFGDDADEPAWIGIGYITSELGGLLFVARSWPASRPDDPAGPRQALAPRRRPRGGSSRSGRWAQSPTSRPARPTWRMSTEVRHRASSSPSECARPTDEAGGRVVLALSAPPCRWGTCDARRSPSAGRCPVGASSSASES
jgi:hypothetical protein